VRVGHENMQRAGQSSSDSGDGEPVGQDGSKGGSKLSPFEVD